MGRVNEVALGIVDLQRFLEGLAGRDMVACGRGARGEVIKGIAEQDREVLQPRTSSPAQYLLDERESLGRPSVMDEQARASTADDRGRPDVSPFCAFRFLDEGSSLLEPPGVEQRLAETRRGRILAAHRPPS